VQILNYKIHKRFLQNNKNPLKTEFHLWQHFAIFKCNVCIS
jgi:hypothetical protein